jgi:DNA polymerase I-like protein with 3'-5' exonuclease and polymerase domains
MISSPEIGPLIEIKIHSQQEWRYAFEKIKTYGICGLTLGTAEIGSSVHTINIISIALPDKTVYISDCSKLEQKDVKGIAGLLAWLLEQRSIKKVICNARPALATIREETGRKIDARNVFDLMLASQICWSGYYYLTPSGSAFNPWRRNVPDHCLASLAERHFGIILNGQDGCEGDERGNGRGDGTGDALKQSAVLLPLHGILAELLARNGLQRIAELEFKAASSLAEMQISGIQLDCDQARAFVSREEGEICNLVWTMQDEARKKGFVTVSHDGKRLCCYLNPDRTEDVMAYLRRRGYAVNSTKAEVLKGLAATGCAFAEALLHYRRVSHQIAFLNRWLERVSLVDGRVHPQYFQIQSATGRISSRNPNAQQIPSAGEDAPAIRRLFAPATGKKFVKADFSTIELRIMARLSGDRAMQEAFKGGVDLHRLTASQMAGVPVEQVTDVQRKAGKIMNFLLIYGGSARTLQSRILSDYGIFMPSDEAERARERFFLCYQGVREWQERQLSEMSFTVQHHFHNCIQGFFALPLTATTTLLGRRRIWPRFGAGIRASKFQMYNTPCQGTGADLIKLVMCEVYDKISSQEARIINSIHDEILLEVPEERAAEYARMLKEIMERVGSELLAPVPVKAEVKVLDTLAE